MLYRLSGVLAFTVALAVVLASAGPSWAGPKLRQAAQQAPELPRARGQRPWLSNPLTSDRPTLPQTPVGQPPAAGEDVWQPTLRAPKLPTVWEPPPPVEPPPVEPPPVEPPPVEPPPVEPPPVEPPVEPPPVEPPPTEPPPPVLARLTLVEGASSVAEGGSVSVSVVLEVSGQAFLPYDAAVELSVQGGSAQSGQDWHFADQTEPATSGVIVFPAGSVTGETHTVTLVVLEDTAVEGPEVVVLGVHPVPVEEDPSVGRVSWSQQPLSYELTLRDAQRASVAFVGSHVEALEGASDAGVIVELRVPADCQLEHAVTVAVGDARSGTARADEDYRLESNELVFAAGSADGSQQAVQLALLDDAVHEPQEGIVLELAVQAGPASGDEPRRCMLSLLDDDAPSVAFVSSTSEVALGSAISVELRLDVPGGGALHTPVKAVLRAWAGDWSDDLPGPTWAAGASDGATQTVTMPFPDVGEADEVVLTVGEGSATHRVTIRRPEPPPPVEPPPAETAEPPPIASTAVPPAGEPTPGNWVFTILFLLFVLAVLVLLGFYAKDYFAPAAPVIREDDDAHHIPGEVREPDPNQRGLPGSFITGRFRDPSAAVIDHSNLVEATSEVDAFFDSLMETHDDESALMAAGRLMQLEEEQGTGGKLTELDEAELSPSGKILPDELGTDGKLMELDEAGLSPSGKILPDVSDTQALDEKQLDTARQMLHDLVLADDEDLVLEDEEVEDQSDVARLPGHTATDESGRHSLKGKRGDTFEEEDELGTGVLARPDPSKTSSHRLTGWGLMPKVVVVVRSKGKPASARRGKRKRRRRRY